MSEQYIEMGTNVVCTNMTISSPLKIGTPSRICTALTKDKLPVLRIVDTKISNCFECRVPQMKWEGVRASILGIAAGALIVAGAIALIAATVATGGLAAGIVAGIGAAILPESLAALTVSVYIADAILIGSKLKLGYDLKHLCDASLEATWDMGLPSTIIEGEQAILVRSFIPCPQGGIITLIIDDGLAEHAACMIADRNSEIINKEWWGQFYQGMISGATGAANPVSMAITAIATLKDGFDGYADDDLNIDQYEMLRRDKEFEYDYQEKIEDEAYDIAKEEGIEKKRGKGTYNDAKENWGKYKESKQNEAKAIEKHQKAEGKAARREQKISNRSSDKMKGRAKGERQRANHKGNVAKQATQEAKYAKGKFIGGLIGFGMGIGGAAVNMLIDKGYKEEEFNITKETVRRLQEIKSKDKVGSEIISDGK
ncbi:hypothetical protein [Prevotella melaninogenica]|uniref:hypothetical protein n=1 Tax=Prevotella melaninogenica TaxID=28132 RepID=UPI001C604053|nr:hypothetical protein [Prevotella melaninogenica]MBW4730125.1 hypothetical protein [Prevotella melaninogenica]MBW4732256.1 hypothetical protein [Prevotella melaninogenica]MBW4750310.1 hypothetical protein [Prevotella melaninogenica]